MSQHPNFASLLDCLRNPDLEITSQDFEYSEPVSNPSEPRNWRSRVPIDKLAKGYSAFGEGGEFDHFYVILPPTVGHFVELEGIAAELARLIGKKIVGPIDNSVPAPEKDFDGNGEYIGITRGFEIDQRFCEFMIKVREHGVRVDIIATTREGIIEPPSIDKAMLDYFQEQTAVVCQYHSRNLH